MNSDDDTPPTLIGKQAGVSLAMCSAQLLLCSAQLLLCSAQLLLKLCFKALLVFSKP